MKRLLIAIAGTLLATSALAQDAPGQAIGGIVEALGLRKPPPPAPDFVRESRPTQLEYAPMAPKPDSDPKKRAAALRASGADLDSAAAETRRRAARVKSPD